MKHQSKIFKSTCIDLSNNNYLHIVDVEKMDSKLISFIDENIFKICAGENKGDVDIIKQELINFLTPKKNGVTEMGAIAEFFAHLYLNEIGFNQQFLYLNLEEESIKKGFDGYYTLDDEEWIYESKSSTESSKEFSHNSNISAAYNDLKKKIAGNTKNNPWKNAYNHARIIDNKNDILKNIKTLSDSFIKKKFRVIKDFNIIPSSTLFLEGSWTPSDTKSISKKIIKLISKYDYQGINVICMSKKSIDLFWDYLNN
jgi:hypothetical protein